MSVFASTRSKWQMNVLNLLVLGSVVVAIYGRSATAARLLPEDRGFYIFHVNASTAPLVDSELIYAVDGSSVRQPEPASEVSRSNNHRHGIESVVDANDTSRPEGFNIINAQSAEVSYKGGNIRSKPHWSSWSGSNNRAKELVFNVFPKGPVTPSGPSHKGHAAVTERRLSESKHSPGVGHMQKTRKRILGSVPSPGDGH